MAPFCRPPIDRSGDFVPPSPPIIQEETNPDPAPPAVLLEDSPLLHLLDDPGLADRHELVLQLPGPSGLQRISNMVPLLSELSLDGSLLTSLRDLGSGMSHLKSLSVCNCGLTSLDGTFGLPLLQRLTASNNPLEDPGPCSSLYNLQRLDLSRTNVSDLALFSFLRFCEELQDLWLEGTPAATTENYRGSVAAILPKLAFLDGRRLEENGSPSALPNIQAASGEEPESSRESTMTQTLSTSSISLNPRPSTGMASFRNPASRRRRAQSARERGDKTESSECLGDVDLDSTSSIVETGRDTPSSLTSGTVICGNLVAALRAQRRQTLPVSQEADSEEDDDTVLAASRHWREDSQRRRQAWGDKKHDSS